MWAGMAIATPRMAELGRSWVQGQLGIHSETLFQNNDIAKSQNSH